MMLTPVTSIIQARFSCRSYLDEPIALEKQQSLREFMKGLMVGPFGAPVRFDLVASGFSSQTEQASETLRGLGTYGFIRGASGFVVGALRPGAKDLEDYGYRLEQIVLYATQLGLGTCWLGGTFTKSSFARKIAVAGEERVPAVVALGHIADEVRARRSLMRQYIGADRRLAWEKLFFEGDFRVPLAPDQAGPYLQALEMVRLGPSASNRQPWRIVQQRPDFGRTDSAARTYHFYLQRTKGYRNGLTRLVGIEDMQRLDLGIAMCHFELTAQELSLKGRWIVQEPPIEKPQEVSSRDNLMEYIASWVEVE